MITIWLRLPVLAVVAIASLVISATHALAAEFAVFIIAGESNALGRGSDVAELPPNLLSPQPDVLLWYEEGPANSVQNQALRIRSGGFVPLQYQTDVTGATFGGPANGYGPEITFGRHMAEYLTPGWPILPDSIAIVKFAFDSTSLEVDWNPDSAGSLYHQMIALTDLAIATLESRGNTAAIRGLLWIQGEQDAQNSNYAAAYGENLNQIVCGIRRHSGRDQMVAAIDRLAYSFDNECCQSLPHLSAVRSAQVGISDSTDCAYWIDSDQMPVASDSLHFTSTAQLRLGDTAAEVMEGCALYIYDCFPCFMGDANHDDYIGVVDVVTAINVAFRGGTSPGCPYYSLWPLTDYNCDGMTDVTDVVRTINVAFRGAVWNYCNPCNCHPYPGNCPEPCKRANL